MTFGARGDGVRLHVYDDTATGDLPAWPPVGIPAGMPFLLDGDGRPVRAVNDWLRTLPVTGAPSPRTWLAYGRAVTDWARFLVDRGADLLAPADELRRQVAAYHADRRMGTPERRLGTSSWNRDVRALTSFYRWAVDEAQVDRVPFTLKTIHRYVDGQRRTQVRNTATEKPGRRGATIRWLDDAYLELFVDVGLAGQLPDGSADPDFRGREGERNAAVAAFAAGCGLRPEEWAHLLVWEIPPVPDVDTPVVPMSVPASIAKGGKHRTTWVDRGALQRLHTYLRLERPLAVDGSAWQPDRPLPVTAADAAGGRAAGRKVRWDRLRPAERRRLVAPGGGTPLLGPTATGAPLTDWRYTFTAAAQRTARFEPGFPHVTPHMLRHTFAVATLKWLVATQLADVADLLDHVGGDPVWAAHLRRQDPLLVVRDLLGHASVTTTEVYLGFVDPMRLFTDSTTGPAS